MRYIYMDEAGTSLHEPVTVVVGVVANADEHVMLADAALHEALGSVPAPFREGFVFHATDIWGSSKYREAWTMADRLKLLKTVMSLPRRIGMSVSMAMVRRTHVPGFPLQRISLEQYHHFKAFSDCVASADRYIRDHCGLKEGGTIVAEDCHDMRKYLRKIPKMLRDNPIVLGPGMVLPTAQEEEQGYVTQNGDYRVSRIRNAIHFVEKDDDPLVQIADACAFAFRRWFAGEDFGPDFVTAVLGRPPPNMHDFRGDSSFITYRFHL